MSVLSMRGLARREGSAVAITLLVLIIGVTVLVGSLLMDKLVWAQETLEAIEPRYARLLGLSGVGPSLDTALQEVRGSLERRAYPSSISPERIGTDAQERIRSMAESAGLAVSGSQILPVRAHPGFVQIPLKVTVDGDLESLRKFLAAADTAMPVVLVDSLQVASIVRRARRGAAEPPQRLNVQLSLSVLRLQP